MMDEARVNAEDRAGMTPAQWDRYVAFIWGFGDEDDDGLSISLLWENLRLTPTQRIERMCCMSRYISKIEQSK